MIASLHLTGAPPFAVHYTVTRLSGPGAPRTMHYTRRVSHSRDEFRFDTAPGDWEYRFTSVTDAFYNKLPLDGGASLVRRQSIPVVGNAKWRDAAHGKTVHSCEGETVQVEIDLEVRRGLNLSSSTQPADDLREQGVAPWEVEYAVVGQPSKKISGITRSPYAFDIDIPTAIAKQGGQFALSLGERAGLRRPQEGKLTPQIRRERERW